MSNDNTMALALAPRSVTECNDLAKQLSASSLLPVALRNKIPEVMMTIMAGQELGIPPIAALRSIHVIEGKTVLSADIMQAVVLGNGSAVYVKRISASDTEATYETLRKGDSEPRRMTWTIEMAKKAGLYPTKDNWRMYPRAMLSARCKAELLRDVYADSLAGCYTPDESEDWSRPNAVPFSHQTTTADAIDVDFTDVPSTPVAAPVVSPFIAIRDQLIADISAATSVAALDALLPRFAGLPRETAARERASAHAIYKSRMLVVEKLPPVTESVIDTTATEVVSQAVAS